MAAGEPAALSVACSINSGGSGTDWSLTLISDSGADAQVLTAAHTDWWRGSGTESGDVIRNTLAHRDYIACEKAAQ